MADLEQISSEVISGNVDKVVDLTQQAIDEGEEPTEIINQGLISGMKVVGQRFKEGEMFVPQVMMAAEAMKSGVDLIKPLLAEADYSSKGTVVLGTVNGDVHDIGKDLVATMMESGSLEVIDVGEDIPAEEFAEAIKEHEPDILGLSALLTTTMPELQNVIEVLKEEGLRDSVKVLIGGAPVTEDYAEEIGADGFAQDAASAKDLALEIVD